MFLFDNLYGVCTLNQQNIQHMPVLIVFTHEIISSTYWLVVCEIWTKKIIASLCLAAAWSPSLFYSQEYQGDTKEVYL